jgi:hypothetical protein
VVVALAQQLAESETDSGVASGDEGAHLRRTYGFRPGLGRGRPSSALKGGLEVPRKAIRHRPARATRVGFVSDHFEIQQVLHRAAWSYDEEDLDVLASCYTEDATVVLAGETTRGRSAVREMFAERRATTDEKQPNRAT